MAAFDVMVIGHLTKDIIRIDGKIVRELVGGTAYYTSIALHTLGVNVAAAVKTSPEDRDSLLFDLKARNIPVFWQPSQQTSIFEDIYPTKDLDFRVEKVWATADPFSEADLPEFCALTNRDLDGDFLAAVAGKGEIISLDAQGLTREILANGDVRSTSWREGSQGLSSIDILKADEKEALILTETEDIRSASRILTDVGVKEIVITAGSRGAQIFSGGETISIPAVPPRKIVDATGCGDTYMAGYLSQRCQQKDIEIAGKFAAMVASRKIENFGALLEYI
jgi:hypothetical protein